MAGLIQIPTHMKAWRWSESDLDLYQADAAIPTLNSDDLLIRNHVSGLNPVDWKFIDSLAKGIWPDGQIPGVDGAGVVVAAGNVGLEHWIGKRVCYHQSLRRDGSFAEYTAVQARAVIVLAETGPDHKELSFETAAAFPCPVMTAFQAIEKVPLKPEARVLISGASGSVGRALLQLAKKKGFHVTALASESRHKALDKLGADICRVRATEDDTFYAVFDSVSSEHAASLVSQIEANGHLVCIQDRVEHSVIPAFTKTISVHEVALGAMHQFGSDEQWHVLVAEAQRLMTWVKLPEVSSTGIKVEDFTNLRSTIQQVKNKREALKYCFSIAQGEK